MKYLSTALRIRLGLTNPYQIKQEYKLLKKDCDRIPAYLYDRKQLNYDTYVLRFKFERQQTCLGLKIGQYVQLYYDTDNRPYVPISRIDDAGFVDFLVRDMSSKVQGSPSFSHKLINIQVRVTLQQHNQKVQLMGPFDNYQYEGYGTFMHQSGFKYYKNIGIIAHETGIGKTYSLIQSIVSNYDNITGVSLLWVGRGMNDFIFLQQFGSWVERGKLNMNLMLQDVDSSWVGPFAPVSTQHIEQYMPLPADDTLMITSGTPEQLTHLEQCLHSLNYRHII